MGVVFGVLVLLLFAIKALGLIDRLVQRREAVSVPEVGEAVPASQRSGPGAGIIAAIAAALALAEDESSTPGRITGEVRYGGSADAWAQAGRRRLMDSRRRPSR